MRAALASVAALTIAALTVSACSAPTSDIEVGPGKSGTGEPLSSIELMAERVPAIADAEAVTYYGGYLGAPDSGREITVPGPTDLWIDAAVTLQPGQGAALATGDGVQAVDAPNVVPPLAAELPSCEWQTSPALAERFTGIDGWDVSATLCAQADLVVLVMYRG